MRTIAKLMLIVPPLLIPACVHKPMHRSEARLLSAAPFTESTMAAQAPVTKTSAKTITNGPYAELPRAVTDETLRSDVQRLLLELGRNESNPEFRIKLGEVLLKGGRPELAIAPLRDAFYLRPGRAGIAALLTRAYVEAKKFAQALELARRMVSERPDESGRWLFLAEVERLAGNPQRSLDAASRALLINPSAHEAKAVLGFLYADRGQNPLARKLLTEVLEKPGVEAAALEHRLGRLEIEEENWQPALDYLDACLRKEPAMAAALNDRGVVYARLGRWDAARQDFASAVRIAPQLAEAQVNHANMKIDAGIRSDAQTALAAAQSVGTDPGAFYIAAGRLYALDASTQTGRASALQYLQRARDLVPPETRKELDRAVSKIRSLPLPKPAPVAAQPEALPTVPAESLSTPAPASPVRNVPEESSTGAESAEPFRPAVE